MLLRQDGVLYQRVHHSHGGFSRGMCLLEQKIGPCNPEDVMRNLQRPAINFCTVRIYN
jgi:hypothetical protein